MHCEEIILLVWIKKYFNEMIEFWFLIHYLIIVFCFKLLNDEERQRILGHRHNNEYSKVFCSSLARA